jgi:hypothetical protein
VPPEPTLPLAAVMVTAPVADDFKDSLLLVSAAVTL